MIGNQAMECWSDGVMRQQDPSRPFHSITPLLHYSITPMV
jgi:hypothetical protein